MIDKALLAETVAAFGVTLTQEACEKLDIYARLLVEWNEKMNLTAITAPRDIVVKHFVDSLTALPLLPEKKGFSLIDVGTGAGFPGIPLAIACPDMKLTLLDSLNKRLTFLNAVCEAVGIDAVTVHARAEEGGQNPALRERFDVATARAVAALPTLSEYCLPFVKVGGRFIAMKGPESRDEAAAAASGIALLGGKTPVVRELKLPAVPQEGEEQLERRLFVIEKGRPTPKQYPRPTAKIKAKSL